MSAITCLEIAEHTPMLTLETSRTASSSYAYMRMGYVRSLLGVAEERLEAVWGEQRTFIRGKRLTTVLEALEATKAAVVRTAGVGARYEALLGPDAPVVASISSVEDLGFIPAPEPVVDEGPGEYHCLWLGKEQESAPCVRFEEGSGVATSLPYWLLHPCYLRSGSQEQLTATFGAVTIEITGARLGLLRDALVTHRATRVKSASVEIERRVPTAQPLVLGVKVTIAETEAS